MCFINRRALALLQIRDEIAAQMVDGVNLSHRSGSDAAHHVVGMLDQQICEIEDGFVGDGKDVIRRMLMGI